MRVIFVIPLLYILVLTNALQWKALPTTHSSASRMVTGDKPKTFLSSRKKVHLTTHPAAASVVGGDKV